MLAEALYQEPAPPSYQADSTSDSSHLTKSGSLCLHSSRTQSGGVAFIKFTPRLWSVELARMLKRALFKKIWMLVYSWQFVGVSTPSLERECDNVRVLIEQVVECPLLHLRGSVIM